MGPPRFLFLSAVVLACAGCKRGATPKPDVHVAPEQPAKKDGADLKTKADSPSGSLASGGIVLFPDGTKRKFKKVQGENQEPQSVGGVLTLDLVDYIKFREFHLGERKIPCDKLSRIKFERSSPADFEAVREQRRAMQDAGKYDEALVKPVGTYPPFVELTYLDGRKERFRTENTPFIVTWGDVAFVERRRFSECWSKEQNGIVLMVNGD